MGKVEEFFEKARFQAWVKTKLPSASLEHGDLYLNSLVEIAWQGWQAALASRAPNGCPMAEPTCPMEINHQPTPVSQEKEK